MDYTARVNVKVPGNKPFQIEIAFNAPMGAWDLHVGIGGFASEQEAIEYSAALAEFLAGATGFYEKVTN